MRGRVDAGIAQGSDAPDNIGPQALATVVCPFTLSSIARTIGFTHWYAESSVGYGVAAMVCLSVGFGLILMSSSRTE